MGLFHFRLPGLTSTPRQWENLALLGVSSPVGERHSFILLGIRSIAHLPRRTRCPYDAYPYPWRGRRPTHCQTVPWKEQSSVQWAHGSWPTTARWFRP